MKKILIIIVLFFPLVVQAAGIQVTPERLEFEIAASKSQTKEITVANPTADVQLFEVYPDDFESIINVNPKSFTLEAGGQKEVSVTIKPDSLSAGVLSTNLSIVGKPLAESRVQVNTGVKIPVTVKNAKPEYKNFLPIIVAVAIAVGIIAGNFLLQRLRSKNSG